MLYFSLITFNKKSHHARRIINSGIEANVQVYIFLTFNTNSSNRIPDVRYISN